MPVILGTSGWQYRSWKQPFYSGLPQKSWLDRYVEMFASVEVNNAFYRLPERKTFAQWHDRTPDDFVVAVKMSRYLTHIKRLKDPDEPVQRFLERVDGLGSKLGPVLLQLPPNLQADTDSLRRTLALFPAAMRVTVEFRHPSWFSNETRAVLERAGAAFCLADSARLRTPHWRTAEWGYLRFHEGRATPRPCYGRTALRSWAERLSEMWAPGDDVYVYFNNDTNVCALRDAGVFAREVERTGRSSTRAPDPRSVPVGPEALDVTATPVLLRSNVRSG